MFKRLRGRMTYANVASSIALFVAVSTGGAYAANTVGSADIIDDSILSQDVNNGTLASIDLADNSVLTAKIAAFAVTNSDLAPNSVGTGKIADGAVQTTDVLANAITNAKIAPDAVTSPKIADGNVLTDDLADGAVTSAKVLDESLAPADLGPNSVGSSEIQTDAVNATEVANDSIDSGEIVDFGLSNQDVGVLFAQVNADATVANSSGGVTVADLGTGTYEVDFGRNISTCAFVVTQGESGTGGAAGAITGATDRSGNAEAAFVTIRTNANALVDRAFQMVVVC
jgi:hypothetical protein